MPEYQWALGNGQIVAADYQRKTDTLSNEQVQAELLSAFQQFGHNVICEAVSGQKEVYQIIFADPCEKPIILCVKGTTPGGRANLNDEQRIQPQSRSINYAYEQQQAGNIGALLGVYQREGQTIFCAWKLNPSTAGAGTTVSKQIKITTIAKAMQEGFVQQKKSGGEYACAFRKEFMYFYIRNAEWLHGTTVDHLNAYTEPLDDEVNTDNVCHALRFATELTSQFSRNRILFGAPGTGKSFTLNQDKEELLSNGGAYERVTFHPDYSYANFVGTYKPVPCKDSEDREAITYSYVPGPFMRTYVKALQNSRTDDSKPFLLIIEEINRANVAAVFGDIFQLLDRGDDEVSEYPIQASEDIRNYLAKELDGTPEEYAELRIPDNMFIWATMNSADQGVFPLDTAFKRRWDFTYLGIDAGEAGIAGKKVILGQGNYRRSVEWNALRKAINNELLTYKVNEDKLMGPYFITRKNLSEGNVIDTASFARIFKNKVIMYLFDDAAKQRRPSLFSGCNENARNQYSKICSEFDTKGVHIFCEAISSQFIDTVPEDDAQ